MEQDRLIRIEEFKSNGKELVKSPEERYDAEGRTKMSLNIPDSAKEYFESVKEFAKKVGKEKDLQEKLDYLDTYACHGEKDKTRCILMKDWAPMSFKFRMEMRNRKTGEYEYFFNGGLIFHGSHDGFGDGSAPTLSVTLSPTDGWSIHT